MRLYVIRLVVDMLAAISLVVVLPPAITCADNPPLVWLAGVVLVVNAFLNR